MDTFEDTLTNEDYARILHNLPADSGDLLLSNEAERIWKGFVDYHSYPNPFDCIENDTELMEGFLDGSTKWFWTWSMLKMPAFIIW